VKCDYVEDKLEQLKELFHRQAGLPQAASEGAGANFFVVGNDEHRRRVVAAKHHVAPVLAAEIEADLFEDLLDLAARQVGRELHEAI
jgi:hypothetical protein